MWCDCFALRAMFARWCSRCLFALLTMFAFGVIGAGARHFAFGGYWASPAVDLGLLLKIGYWSLVIIRVHLCKFVAKYPCAAGAV